MPPRLLPLVLEKDLQAWVFVVAEVSLQPSLDASSFPRARGPLPPPQQGTVAARTSHAPASTEARLNALLGRPPMVCARCPHQGGHLHPPVETLWFLQCRRRARCPTVSPALPRESLCPAATSPTRLCWPLGEQNWWSGLTGYIYWNCSWQSSQAGRTRCRDGECPFLSRPQPQGLNGGE